MTEGALSASSAVSRESAVKTEGIGDLDASLLESAQRENSAPSNPYKHCLSQENGYGRAHTQSEPMSTAALSLQELIDRSHLPTSQPFPTPFLPLSYLRAHTRPSGRRGEVSRRRSLSALYASTPLPRAEKQPTLQGILIDRLLCQREVSCGQTPRQGVVMQRSPWGKYLRSWPARTISPIDS